MLRIPVIFSLAVLIVASANAQPANDDPCNAITLTVAPNLEECTPTQAIQWAAATATNTPNPVCASGQLLDVWYKFLAPANGKVNIRTSLPAGATNDGAMVAYSAASCNGPFTEVGCNDDYNGFNPGLNLTGLIAGQTYYIRMLSFSAGSGNYLICLANPAPAPPPIDPNKRVGINYDFPEANLDVNGDLIVRGGNPQPGRVLAATNSKGKVEWKDITSLAPGSGRKLFKVALTGNQSFFGEARVNFNNEIYDIGNGYDTAAKKYIMYDTAGSIYQFSVSLNYAASNVSPVTLLPNVLVYQNGNIKYNYMPLTALPYISIPERARTLFFTFELKCETGQDEVAVQVVAMDGAGITIYATHTASGNLPSFFSGQKIY